MDKHVCEMVRTESRLLPVRLTPDELLDRGSSLAAVIQDIDSEERRQTDQKAQMKARLAELDARRTQLAVVIGRKEEDRYVEVQIFNHYDRGVVDVVRVDTGETVSSRRMTDEERQQRLPE